MFSNSSSAPFTSSPFSLFSGGIPAPVFQTPVSTGAAKTSYIAPHTNNPVAMDGILSKATHPLHNQQQGNSTFTYGNMGKVL